MPVHSLVDGRPVQTCLAFALWLAPACVRRCMARRSALVLLVSLFVSALRRFLLLFTVSVREYYADLSFFERWLRRGGVFVLPRG